MLLLTHSQAGADPLGTMRADSPRMTRRDFLARAAALGLGSSAILSMASACGGSGGTSPGSPITLSEWDYYNTTDRGDPFLAREGSFTQLHPNLKIARSFIPFPDLKQKVLQGAAAHDLPDLLVINSTDHPSLSAGNVLLDLTDRISAWGQGAHYFPGPLHSATWKGRIYGLPNVSNCLALYYNVDLFEQAGVTPPATWDALRSTAKTLSKNGVYGFAMSATNSQEGTFQFLPFLWQAGADWDTLAGPAAREALQLLVTLIADGSMSKEVVNWTQADALDQFISGTAAMCENGPWQVPTLKQKATFRWAACPLPRGQVAATSLGGENWSIPATSAHADDAWEFMTFTQDPQRLKAYLVAAGALPGRKDIATDPVWQNDPVLSVFVNQFPVARPLGGGTNFSHISDIFTPALQAALSGQLSAADALAQAARSIEPLLH